MNITSARNELFLGKSIYDMNLKVTYYGRVSTDKSDQLNSLENQENYFKDFINSISNWIYVKGYSDEGISGTNVSKRDSFLRMIEDGKKGKFDLILTKEVSRFARNTIDSISYTEMLLKFGIVVYFISDNINTLYPDSEFRLTIMASVAQDEVRKLSERVKFGIKRSIKDGKLGGSCLTGYIKKNGKLIINKKEEPIVKMLFSLYATEKYGLNKIALILADNGFFTKKGKIYSSTTLKKMLTNPRYKGYYTANLSEIEDYKTHKKRNKSKDEWIVYKDTKGIVPSIISEELWDKCNCIYEKKHNCYRKTKNSYSNSYTSKLFCKEHNVSFIRCASGRRKNKPMWVCNEYYRYGLKGCISPIICEKELNNIFFNVLKDALGDKKELLNSMIGEYKEALKKNVSISKHNDMQGKLLNLYLEGKISKELFDLKNNELIKNKKEGNNTNSSVNCIKNIKENLEELLDLKNNVGLYFDLLVSKVFISKINNDRKCVELEIRYKTGDTQFVRMGGGC